jgi:hypothetical protein
VKNAEEGDRCGAGRFNFGGVRKGWDRVGQFARKVMLVHGTSPLDEKN